MSSRSKPFTATLLALALTALAAPALAQGGGASGRAHHGHHGGHGRFTPEAMEHRLDRLTVVLGLDEHQVGLVREIFAAARTEAEALRDLPRGDGRRDARRALFESVADRIDAVLTDAQRETFTRIRTAMRERHDARREHREERSAPEGI